MAEKEPKKESKEKTPAKLRVGATLGSTEAFFSLLGVGSVMTGTWPVAGLSALALAFLPGEEFPKGPYAKFMDRLLGATKGEEKPGKKPEDAGSGKKAREKMTGKHCMEEFFNQIVERIAIYRASLEGRGFSDEELTQKAADRFNSVVLEYYEKLMELMTEADYQAYKSALERKDAEALQSVLAGYKEDVLMLQDQLVDSL